MPSDPAPSDPPLHDDRRRAESFGEDPERYDRVRPTYPAELVKALLALAPSVVDRRAEVLDVGCGTGIVARLFADRGAAVLGIEPDERMATFARRRGVSVEEGRFERWSPRGRRFDLVVAGQAWHWVDPEQGSLRAAEVLRAGGAVGLFWNKGFLPAELESRLRAVYARRAPGLEQYSVLLGNSIDDRLAVTRETLSSSGCFEDVVIRAFPHEVRHTTASWSEHLLTHSDHRALPEPVRRALLDEVEHEVEAVGSRFTLRYEARAVLGRRKARPTTRAFGPSGGAADG